MQKFIINKIISAGIGFFLIVFTFSQCRKNEEQIFPVEETPVYVKGNICGRVVDEKDLPLKDVSVYADAGVITDNNGVFILNDQKLDTRGARISFNKQGYYHVVKNIIPIKGKTVNINIKLVPKKLISTVSSSNPTTIKTKDNAEINLPKDGIIDRFGISYDGLVNVYAYYLDPSNNNTFLEMPGNLTGRNVYGELGALQTMGMLMVELEDLSGSALNIKRGSVANLKIPIPSSFDAQAKSIIPMWYYDNIKGIWLEEGEGKRDGNYYVGNVSHFSTWNWDFFSQAINLKFKIVDAKGKPASFEYFDIYELNSGTHGNGTTNADGSFEGKVPANSRFKLMLAPSTCNSNFEKEFITGNTDLDLGDIIIPDKKLIHFTGIALECKGQNLKAGYLIIQNNFMSNIFNITNGTFDFFLKTCLGDKLNYYIVDFNNKSQSYSKDILVDNQLDIKLGNIDLCEQLNNYLILDLDGAKYNFEFISNDSIDVDSLTYAAISPNSTVEMQFANLNIGTSNLKNFILFEFDKFNISCSCSTLTATFTRTGKIGEICAGSIQGTVINELNSKQINVDGEFRFERKK